MSPAIDPRPTSGDLYREPIEKRERRVPTSLLSLPNAVSGRNRFDVATYVLLSALGALQIIFGRHVADFAGDVTYLELAKSIVHGAGYGFNFKPETMLPPGFPYLLALLTLVLGSSYAVLIRTMAAFTTLALIFSYDLLRTQTTRKVAAAVCILIASSPVVFQFSTTLVFSDMPYFFTSTMLLWALMRLEIRQGERWKRTLWWLLCLVLVVVSVLLRSTGMALLGGVVGWLVVSARKDRAGTKKRVLVFLPLVIAGMAAQVSWMHWAVKHQSAEWPIHGYQENYLYQLGIKNGNNPESGLATWKDVLMRPVENADDRISELGYILSRKAVAPAWYSPTTVLPIAILALGLGYSFWTTGGGVLEWYFLIYESMYLFWPWNFEERFLLPVAPLACLYLWKGGVLLARFAKARPRLLAATGLTSAAIGIISTILWGRNVHHPRARACLAMWALVAAASVLLWAAKQPRVAQLSAALRKRFGAIGGVPVLLRIGAAAALAVLLVIGIRSQVRLGIANLHFRIEDDAFYPDREAAQWIEQHSATSAVVMARKDDIVYHYGHRRVIWFPPSTDPTLLMNGIRKYHVQFVIVGDGNDGYWSPPAEECFRTLSAAYPHAFRLVYEVPHGKVYSLSPDSAD